VIRTLKVRASKRSFWRKFLLRVGLLRQKPRPKPTGSFEDWLREIREKDPAAYDELINLGKTPFARETNIKREGVN
jgi:hypothetical protein